MQDLFIVARLRNNIDSTQKGNLNESWLKKRDVKKKLLHVQLIFPNFGQETNYLATKILQIVFI